MRPPDRDPGLVLGFYLWYCLYFRQACLLQEEEVSCRGLLERSLNV